MYHVIMKVNNLNKSREAGDTMKTFVNQKGMKKVHPHSQAAYSAAMIAIAECDTRQLDKLRDLIEGIQNELKKESV